jgi:hypothetical protein
MLPECTAADAKRSDDVCTVTSSPPVVGWPNVNPFNVKVKADAGGIAAPAVVMTMDVLVVAPHVAVKPATLLAPAATTGVTEGAKKEAG